MEPAAEVSVDDEEGDDGSDHCFDDDGNDGDDEEVVGEMNGEVE